MIALLCAFLAVCLGEFLIACMICSIMNYVVNRKNIWIFCSSASHALHASTESS